jgi:hypothetical protein
MDDLALARHLQRRAQVGAFETERERAGRLWAAAFAVVENEKARRSRWPAFNTWQPGLAAVLVIMALVLASGIIPPGTSSGTHDPGGGSAGASAAVPSVELLDASELAALTAPDAWSANTGRVVLVEADLTFVYGAMCKPDTDCLVGYFQASEPIALRVNRSLVSKVDPTRPLAVVVTGEHQVDLVGALLMAGARITWTASELREALAAQRAPDPAVLYAVDGWLGHAGPIPCPAPIDANGNIGTWGPYGCGDVAWLAIDDTPRAHPPLDGLRVQNGAYQAFAPLLGPSAAQSGVYLVRAPIVEPDDCFGCEGSVPAEIVARLAPIAGPATEPDASPVPTPQINARQVPVLTPDALAGLTADDHAVPPIGGEAYVELTGYFEGH